jgi:serine-threonine kinase receptor-associated protein
VQIQMAAAKQSPLTCGGHTRPVVDLSFSSTTPDGVFLVTAAKGVFGCCLIWKT